MKRILAAGRITNHADGPGAILARESVAQLPHKLSDCLYQVIIAAIGRVSCVVLEAAESLPPAHPSTPVPVVGSVQTRASVVSPLIKQSTIALDNIGHMRR